MNMPTGRFVYINFKPSIIPLVKPVVGASSPIDRVDTRRIAAREPMPNKALAQKNWAVEKPSATGNLVDNRIDMPITLEPWRMAALRVMALRRSFLGTMLVTSETNEVS